MAETYINSSNVLKLFPTSLRTQSIEGKFTSEDNLTGILRSVTDEDSYIISHENNAYGNFWQFVIHGYYFHIKWPSNEAINVWAHIRVDPTGRLVAANGSTSMDVNNVFMGVKFDNNPSVVGSNDKIYSLQLTDAQGNDCTENYMKISSRSVSYESGGTRVNIEDQFDDIEENKQDLITHSKPLNIEGAGVDSNVSGELDPSHGGTGFNTVYDTEHSVDDENNGLVGIKTNYARRANYAMYLSNAQYEKYNVGSATPGAETPVRFDGGIPIEINGALANDISGTAAKAAMLGTSEGAISAGDASHPVYFNSNGVPVQCNDTLANNISGNAATATNATNATNATYIGGSSSSVGNSNRTIYINNGTPTAGRAFFVVSTSSGAPTSGVSVGDVCFLY